MGGSDTETDVTNELTFPGLSSQFYNIDFGLAFFPFVIIEAGKSRTKELLQWTQTPVSGEPFPLI